MRVEFPVREGGLVRTMAYCETLLREKGVRDALCEEPSTDLRRPHLMAE